MNNVQWIINNVQLKTKTPAPLRFGARNRFSFPFMPGHGLDGRTKAGAGMRGWVKLCLSVFLVAVILAATAGAVWGAPQFFPIPRIEVGVGAAGSPDEVAKSIQIIFFLTILSLAPAIIMMTTSFVRIVIVLSFTRSAIGTNQMPPNQVMIGLALFLTFFTMWPTWTKVNDQALQPFLGGKINQEAALTRGFEPLRQFMFKQTRTKDLKLFVEVARLKPKDRAEIPTQVLIPAFIISELKTAFQIGFMIFIPFLVLDMIVASTLMSMGMMMLPPVMISLPCKILLFVMVDGWHLIARSLILSFS